MPRLTDTVNSFNPASGNPALEESSLRNGSCAFYQRSASLMILGIFEMASKNVCSTSTVVASPDPFTRTPGTSAAIETPKTQKRTSVTLS
jgi:hypothetical protein